MLTIENRVYRVVINPNQGGKIESITYLPQQLELLVAPIDVRPTEDKHDEWPLQFTLAHSYGFDDMFPTIATDDCTSLPWGPIRFPDHGDLWSIPWVCTKHGDSISCEVMGTSFPYRFTRNVSLEDEQIVFHYHLDNLCESSIAVIWAAHILFLPYEHTFLRVPDEITSFLNAYDGGIFGSYGKMVRHNDALFGRHTEFYAHSGLCGKWYTAHKLQEGWIQVIHPEQQIATTVTFPTDIVPYLGVWINEGGWNDQQAIGIEPANAAMDSPSRARQFGMEHILKAHRSESWSLSISVSNYR